MTYLLASMFSAIKRFVAFHGAWELFIATRYIFLLLTTITPSRNFNLAWPTLTFMTFIFTIMLSTLKKFIADLITSKNFKRIWALYQLPGLFTIADNFCGSLRTWRTWTRMTFYLTGMGAIRSFGFETKLFTCMGKLKGILLGVDFFSTKACILRKFSLMKILTYRTCPNILLNYLVLF